MAPIEAMPERRYASILKDPSTSGLVAMRPKRATRNVLTRMDEYEDGPLSVLRRAVKDGIRIRVWTRAHVYIRGICSGFLVAYDKHMNLAMTDVDEEFLIPKSTRDAEYERMRKRKRRIRLKQQLKEEGQEDGKGEGQEDGKEEGQEDGKEEGQEEEDGEVDETEDMETDEKTKQEPTDQSDETDSMAQAGNWRTNEKPQIVSARGKRTFQFGQVHKRHIGQLFIKGDNVVMVSLALN